MTGYISGVYDEDGFGLDGAEIFKAEVNPDLAKSISLNAMTAVCEDNYDRSCSMWGADYNDVAIFFKRIPTAEEINLMASRAKKFAALPDNDEMKIKGFSIINRQVKVEETETEIDPG